MFRLVLCFSSFVVFGVWLVVREVVCLTARGGLWTGAILIESKCLFVLVRLYFFIFFLL